MTLSALSSLLNVAIAHAQSPLPLPGVVEVAKGPSSLLNFVCVSVFTWLFTGAILISIALVLIAAYKFLTSGGDPGKVKSAGQSLVYVAVGVAVAILARSLPVIIGIFVSDKADLDPCKSSVTTTPPKGA